MLANAVLGKNNGEEQVARNAKTLGVGIVQGIEIIRHLLGKEASLLARETDTPAGLAKILIDDHIDLSPPVRVRNAG